MIFGSMVETRQTCNKLHTLCHQVFYHAYSALYNIGLTLKLVLKIFLVTNSDVGHSKVVVTSD